MAGHSGAGAALSAAAKAGDVKGDLVIYDAINGPGERQGFEEWALRRLEEDLIAIKAAKTDADVLRYLQSAPSYGATRPVIGRAARTRATSPST
jgi:hypothetical protein